MVTQTMRVEDQPSNFRLSLLLTYARTDGIFENKRVDDMADILLTLKFNLEPVNTLITAVYLKKTTDRPESH